MKKYQPFARLDDHALTRLVSTLSMKIYPAGTHILLQGERSSGALHIIKEGTVRIYARSADGRETVIDFRGVGDIFGSFPGDEDRPLDISAQAVGDAVCYVADRAGVEKMRSEYPALHEYLLPRFFPNREQRSPRIPPAAGVLRYGSENALFATPVRELATRDIITARADTAILDAVRLMSARRAGALVVVDSNDHPVGMLTTADLRDKVVARQKNLLEPVHDVMSSPIVNVNGSELCFEALLKMMGHDVHHVLVMDGGKPTGIVSNHDFMVLQVTSPLMIVRDIESQQSVEGLSSLSGTATALISLLLSEGARAASINRIITTVNDHIERRALDLAGKTLGPPPVPFCWIVYGSAGRKEQTFLTDQDNGLIYADAPDGGDAAANNDYFSRFVKLSVDALLHCGFELCQGEFMATNPRWCQPLSVWNKYVRDWITTPADVALHNSLNLFDFRGLHGDLHLASDLKKHLVAALRNQNVFLKAVADLTTDYRPPLSLFGSLTLEKSGVHANSLDLKKNCLTPLINIIRLFSFECQIHETSTVERIAALKAVHPVMKTVGGDLEYAWEFMSMIRIRHQLDQVRAGVLPDNFVNPKTLSSLEQRSLLEICRMLTRVLDDIARKYGIATQL